VVPAEFSCRALCVQALHDMMWLFSQLLVSRMVPCRREGVLVYRRSYSFVSRLQGVGHGRPRGLFKLPCCPWSFTMVRMLWRFFVFCRHPTPSAPCMQCGHATACARPGVSPSGASWHMECTQSSQVTRLFRNKLRTSKSVDIAASW
jgi:hypothetical protein